MFKSFLIAVLAVAILATSGFSQAPNVIKHTQDSIVRISWSKTTEEGKNSERYCTGFSVGIMWVLTATHCVPDGNEEVYINGTSARVIKKDDTLALLESPASKYPKLELRKTRLQVGEPLITFGYAYGGDIMVLRRYAAGYLKSEFSNTEHLFIDNPLIMGMSGGPVIDSEGKVIGINQASTGEVGIACPSEEILKFLGEK